MDDSLVHPPSPHVNIVQHTPQEIFALKSRASEVQLSDVILTQLQKVEAELHKQSRKISKPRPKRYNHHHHHHHQERRHRSQPSSNSWRTPQEPPRPRPVLSFTQNSAVNELDNKFNFSLNKLSQSNVEAIQTEVMDIFPTAIHDEMEWDSLFGILMRKAVSQGAYCRCYAQLCQFLSQHISSFAPSFLPYCQNHVEKHLQRLLKCKPTPITSSEGIGLSRFLGELHSFQLIDETLLHSYVNTLFDLFRTNSSTQLEQFEVLLESINQLILCFLQYGEISPQPSFITPNHWDLLQDKCTQNNIPSRYRFKLMDLFDKHDSSQKK